MSEETKKTPETEPAAPVEETASQPEAPEAAETGKEDSGKDDGKTDAPATGDNNIASALCFTAMLISAAGVVLVLKKKHAA